MNSTDKIKIKEAILVEGKYDKITLSQIFDTAIFITDGFGIYGDKKKIAMLKAIAEKNGIIVLTDSDSAGFRIRTYISQCFGNVNINHAYIPEIEGKEKRKDSPSKEGLLGVEGIKKDLLIKAICDVTTSVSVKNEDKITKIFLYEVGLSGGKNSGILRKKLLKNLDLPRKMSTNEMLTALNLICTKDELKNAIALLNVHKND